jgi:hypothetical protein
VAAKLLQYAKSNWTYFKGLFISIERFPRGKRRGRKEEVKVLEVYLISSLSACESLVRYWILIHWDRQVTLLTQSLGFSVVPSRLPVDCTFCSVPGKLTSIYCFSISILAMVLTGHYSPYSTLTSKPLHEYQLLLFYHRLLKLSLQFSFFSTIEEFRTKIFKK